MPRLKVFLIMSRDFGWRELSATLRDHPNIDVVGESTCVHLGCNQAATLHPDVIVSATRVNGESTLRLLTNLQLGRCVASKVILFAPRLDPTDIADAEALRIAGWFLWSELSADGLPHVLNAVLSGEVVAASRPIVDALFNAGERPRNGRPVALAPGVRITPQERAVLRLLALEGEEELTLGEIARRLDIKPSSVTTYVDRLGTKLQVRRSGRRAVVDAARQRMLLPPRAGGSD